MCMQIDSSLLKHFHCLHILVLLSVLPLFIIHTLGYYSYSAFCVHGVFGLLTHNLFISFFYLHQLINWFSLFYVQTVFCYERAMYSLDK